MTDEELLKITSSIEEKLGDSSAIISDDLGLLITGNSQSQKMLQQKEEEIAKLKSTNEKLVLANGNLLKQIPMESKGVAPRNSSEVEEKEIDLSSAFDARGNFKR